MSTRDPGRAVGKHPEAVVQVSADLPYRNRPLPPSCERPVPPSCSCVGFGFIRVRAILVCIFELILLFYQLITSLIIIIKPWPSEDTLRWAWFTQPYLAWVWEAPGWRLWLGAANILFVFVYVAVIKMLFHALFTDNSKWVLPHLVMQAFTVALMVFLSLLTLLTLRGHGQGFAMQVVQITGSTMSNSVSGVGSVLFGMEEFRIQAAKKRASNRAAYRQFLFASRNRTEARTQMLALQNQTDDELASTTTASTAATTIQLPPHIENIIQNGTAADSGRKDRSSVKDRKKKLLPLQKFTRANTVRRSWGQYTPGISMLVALIVYLSITGLSFPFFIITLQCYYFLAEIQKAKNLNPIQDQHLIFAPLNDA